MMQKPVSGPDEMTQAPGTGPDDSDRKRVEGEARNTYDILP